MDYPLAKTESRELSLTDRAKRAVTVTRNSTPCQTDEPTSPPPTPEDPKPPELGPDPVTDTVDEFDTKTVEARIYVSEKVRTRNGVVPEVMAARYFQRGLKRLGYNSKVTYNLAALSPPTEKRDPAFEWFNKQADVPLAKDTNIFLTDRRGGGLAFVGGNKATGPARYVESYQATLREMGEDKQARNLLAILHEFGHNLGAPHDADKDQPGAQHFGMAWNADGYWHKTPNVGGNPGPNACGEPIPERRHQKAMRHLYYADCFGKKLVIRDPE